MITSSRWPLSAAAVLLTVAFVVAPVRVVADSSGHRFRDQGEIVGSLSTAFAAAWAPGASGGSPGLDGLVDYWARYHLAKAVIAALLVAVLVALGRSLWQALAAGPDSRADRARLGLGAQLAAAYLAGLAAVTVLLANVQGMLAPRSSLMSMVPTASAPPGVRAAVARVTGGLAPGAATPADVQGVVDDFARYHAVFAIVGAIAAAVGLWCCLHWFRAGRDRRALGLSGRALGLTMLGYCAFLLVVVAANVSTARNPASALLASFAGGS